QLAVLPGPHGGRHAREKAEHEPLDAVAESLLEYVELEERPDGPHGQVPGPDGLQTVSQALPLHPRVLIDLVEEHRHRRNRPMSQLSADYVCRPPQFDGLVDQPDPSTRIAPEKP